MRRGATLVTGGTDNHLNLIDVASSYGLTGRQAESALLNSGIVTNRNAIPADPNRRLVHLRHPYRHARADHRRAWAPPRWTRSPVSSTASSPPQSPAPPPRAPSPRPSTSWTGRSPTRSPPRRPTCWPRSALPGDRPRLTHLRVQRSISSCRRSAAVRRPRARPPRGVPGGCRRPRSRPAPSPGGTPTAHAPRPVPSPVRLRRRRAASPARPPARTPSATRGASGCRRPPRRARGPCVPRACRPRPGTAGPGVHGDVGPRRAVGPQASPRPRSARITVARTGGKTAPPSTRPAPVPSPCRWESAGPTAA